MNSRETRHITLSTHRGNYLVPTYSHVENSGNALKVKFVFQRDLITPEIEYVIADNEQGYVRMITSKGNEFSGGSLFDQLLVWFDNIVSAAQPACCQ